jgi:hypothetical protein
MATNMTSVDVVAGNDANASEYNNLREDVIVNAGDYETAGGTGNAITLAIDAAISAYAAGQKFRFQASADNTGATTFNVNSIGAKSIVTNQNVPLIGGEILNGQEVEVVYDGTNMQLLTPSTKSSMVFGGNGTDGALDTSGGTVNIDLGNAAVVVKNYSSINIASNNLTFTNPHTNGTTIILKSAGDVTLTATIAANGKGGAGGAGGVSAVGAGGSAGYNIVDNNSHIGAGGNPSSTSAAGGVIYSNLYLYTDSAEKLARKGIFIAAGSGGGGGSGTTGSYWNVGGGGAGAIGGAGGNGASSGNPGAAAGGNGAGGGGGGGSNNTGSGGAGGGGGAGFLIECAGDLNFTGNLDLYGDDGADGTGTGAGGGGGGAGGMGVILYNTLTSAAGTIDTSGGAGGAGRSGGGVGGAGGAGSSSSGGLVAQNLIFS